MVGGLKERGPCGQAAYRIAHSCRIMMIRIPDWKPWVHCAASHAITELFFRNLDLCCVQPML